MGERMTSEARARDHALVLQSPPQLNYFDRRCVVCGGVLALTERKCHKGECALKRKTAKQKARRAARRARARRGDV